jgi:serine/threonine protein kinase
MIERGTALGTAFSLGKITVGEKLGEGGFGIVYVATLEGIDLEFAIKFLDPSPFNQAGDAPRKRFLREANLLFRFRHPSIVPIYGVGEHKGKPYILMERFRGFNLHEARDRGSKPDPLLVLPFLEIVADGLTHAHERNVVHRDIKPSNLMTVKGDARILDFGVAGLLDPNGERFTRTTSAVAGDVFSAPELTDNPKLIDPRCDVYSLGACWFWLLTGTAPKGKNWESKLRASVKVERGYEDVLMRCLDQPENRYSSAKELAADVRALRQGDKPRATSNDLTDDQARILGILEAGCPSTLDNMSFYKIEQELQGRMTRLRSVVALRSLVKRAFVHEETKQEVYDDTHFKVYRPSTDGSDWAEKNIARIEELNEVAVPPPSEMSTPGDDIPF